MVGKQNGRASHRKTIEMKEMRGEGVYIGPKALIQRTLSPQNQQPRSQTQIAKKSFSKRCETIINAPNDTLPWDVHAPKIKLLDDSAIHGGGLTIFTRCRSTPLINK